MSAISTFSILFPIAAIVNLFQISLNELGKSSMVTQQFLIRPHLRNPPVLKDDDFVNFRQVVDPVRDKDPSL